MPTILVLFALAAPAFARDLHATVPTDAFHGGSKVASFPVNHTVVSDPTCANGIISKNICCDAGCGTCGGSGCSSRPGGKNACCGSIIEAANVYCDEGPAPCIMRPAPCDGITNQDVCCASECGTCGGSGCSKRTGGASNCCAGNIRAELRSCWDYPAPCTLTLPSANVLITPPGQAFGHHGACSGWNACGDAETCALWACQSQGYSALVSFGTTAPCTSFDNCNLMYCAYDWSQCSTPGNEPCAGVQYDWGNWCDVMGVGDIVCSNHNFVCPP